MPDATFVHPDLTRFCRLDELGLQVLGQRLEPDRAVLACHVVEADQWCRRCGCEGTARDTVTRQLSHEPLGWRTEDAVCHGAPLPVHRLRTRLAPRHPRRRPSPGRSCLVGRCAGRWKGWWSKHLTVARVAEALAVSWNTANDAILTEGSTSSSIGPGASTGLRDRRR